MLCAAVLALGCNQRTPEERGAALFHDPAVSDSPMNFLSCSSCHTTAPAPGRIVAGGSLENVVGRPSYWGGETPDLRTAVNNCIRLFMTDSREQPLAEDDPDGRDLFSYLETLGTQASPAVPFTVPAVLDEDLPQGDPARGATLYDAGCFGCHGEPHSGAGAEIPDTVVIPDETIEEHRSDAPIIFRAKVRHGGFYGIGGYMPPFSLETLSEQDEADIAAFLGLHP